MRQAGRALPEYRAIRAEHGFHEVVMTPELTAEVTLQPVRRYGVDAAILYSDIMTPVHPIGFGADIEPRVGPGVARALANAATMPPPRRGAAPRSAS